MKVARKVKELLSVKAEITSEEFRDIYALINKTTKEQIKDETVEWLKNNKNHLPM